MEKDEIYAPFRNVFGLSDDEMKTWFAAQPKTADGDVDWHKIIVDHVAGLSNDGARGLFLTIAMACQLGIAESC